MAEMAELAGMAELDEMAGMAELVEMAEMAEMAAILKKARLRPFLCGTKQEIWPQPCESELLRSKQQEKTPAAA